MNDEKEETKYEDEPEGSKIMALAMPNETWFTEVIAKINENWSYRWNKMDLDVSAIKQAQAAGFTTLEANQQKAAEESKK